MWHVILDFGSTCSDEKIAELKSKLQRKGRVLSGGLLHVT